MFKILILVYLIGQDPVDTQKTFILYDNFETIEECKQELLLKTRGNNTYDVLYDFIVSNDFRYDWLVAAFAKPCSHYGKKIEAGVVLKNEKSLKENDLIMHCK